MRVLMAATVFSLALAGCAGGDGDDDHDVGRATECSDAIKAANEPQGQPWGILSHRLENGLGAEATFLIEHLDASGCRLGAQQVTLADGGNVALAYEDHYFGAATRVIDHGSDVISIPAPDWQCSWHKAVTPDGLEDREEAKMCA